MASLIYSSGVNCNQDYPLLCETVNDFCVHVERVAISKIEVEQQAFSINNFIPKIKFKFFGAFTRVNIGNDGRSQNEMDGGERAMSILFGGIIAGVSSFIFGSFYSDYKDASQRLESCKEIRKRYPEIWELKTEHHVALKEIHKIESKLASEAKRSSMINMALAISAIASGALLVIAGLFASLTLALIGIGLIATICVVAMAKFGINHFDHSTKDKSRLLLTELDKLSTKNQP